MDAPTAGGEGRRRRGASDPEVVAQAKLEALTLKEQIKRIKDEKNDVSRAYRPLPLHHSRSLISQVLDAAKGLSEVSVASMTHRRVLRAYQSRVSAMHWSPSEPTRLVSAYLEGRLMVWDAMSSYKIKAIHLRAPWVMTCAMANSAPFVASGGLDNTCSVYNLRLSDESMRPVRELIGHTAYVSACAFISDRQILTASGDSTCVLWDVDINAKVVECRDHSADATCLAPTSDRSTFLSGSADTTAKLWDIRTGQCAQTFNGHDDTVNSLTCVGNGASFCTGSDDGTCRLYDIRADRELMCYAREEYACTLSAAVCARYLV